MGVTPSGLRDKPRVRQDDVKYLDSFRLLACSRGWGESGPQPITVVDVHAYLLLIEESEVDERLRFLRFVQGMDSVYLDHIAKKAAAKK